MSTKERPAATHSTGALTRASRIVAALLCAVVVAWALLSWPSLPDTVPTHVDATGTPDAWGPQWTLLVLLGVWVLIQALLTWLSTRPRLFNYPVEVTESNAPRLYLEGERMMVAVCLGVAVVFAGVVGMSYQLETGAAVVIGLIWLAASTITGLIRTSLAHAG